MISQHLPDVINPINVLMSSELNQIKRKLPRRKKLFHFIETYLRGRVISSLPLKSLKSPHSTTTTTNCARESQQQQNQQFNCFRIILMDWEMLGKQGAGQPAAVPKSQVQAQVQPIANVVVPKLKRRRPMGRPRKAINLSLKSLSDVINALVKKHEHVPYRDSVLTHVLQPYLGKDAKTLMVVNITPTRSSVEETMTSMRFASTAFGSAAVTVQQKSLLHGDSSRRKSPRWS